MTFGSLKRGPVMAQSSFTASPFLYPATPDSSERGARPVVDKPTWAMIPQVRQRAMLSDARALYAGSGLVKGACMKLADYAVGWAWQPTYKGNDPRFRAIAEAIINGWMDTCDIRGRGFSWRQSLRTACLSLDRDGDVFAILTTDPETGGPRIRWVEADRIGQPQSAGAYGQWATVPNMPETAGYAGMKCSCGVVVDDNERPVAFNVMPYEGISVPYTWNLIPAESVVWFRDPQWFSQVRGIPSLCGGILDWYDLQETVAAEKIAAKINSSLALIESNETGRRELAKEAIGAANLPTAGKPGTLEHKTFERGLIRWIKTTGKIDTHKAERPGNGWLALMEHLTRSALLGMGLPYEFVWDSSKIGGAGMRSTVGQVGRVIKTRQEVMDGPAKSILLYAVASYMRRGDIPFAADWWNWDLTVPPIYSVDMGRDSQNRREDFAVGIRSLSEILSEESISVRDHLNQRASDYLLAKEISEEQGVPIQWLVNPSASFGNTADQAIEEAAPTVGSATPAPAE